MSIPMLSAGQKHAKWKSLSQSNFIATLSDTISISYMQWACSFCSRSTCWSITGKGCRCPCQAVALVKYAPSRFDRIPVVAALKGSTVISSQQLPCHHFILRPSSLLIFPFLFNKHLSHLAFGIDLYMPLHSEIVIVLF